MTGVVVGIDGSEGSRRALAWALQYGQSAGAERLQCVHAYDSPLAWIDMGTEYADAMVEHSVRQAKAELDAALAGVVVPAGVALERSALQGNPADVLVDCSRDADLLVVGSRGRGGFTGLLLGSVSQRCAERACCPVVVVPVRDA
jgi:nucleotide-binding universal stress UspA family protein